MPSSIAGPMEEERITSPRLRHQMKKRKKRVAKKACVESLRTPTPEPDPPQVPSSGSDLPQAPVSEPGLPNAPPVIDLEENLPTREPKMAAEPVTEPARAAAEVPKPTVVAAEASEGSAHHAAEMAASSSGSQEEEESILNTQVSLKRSRGAVITVEVIDWAELTPGQLGARAATHAMVPDKYLRHTLATEESSRTAHTDLGAARCKIHQLESDAAAQKSFIEALLSEKEELARERDRLKAEVNGLRAGQEALKLEVESLKAGRTAHTDLRATQCKIHQLKSDAAAQKSFIEALLSEKEELARERDRLKAEVNGLKAGQEALKLEVESLKVGQKASQLEVQGLKEVKAALEHEVEYLKADIKEKTEIFDETLGEAKAQAVIDYVKSSRFDDVMSQAYHKGFKLGRWWIRHAYPDLNISAFTTWKIADDMARQAVDDLDSEDEGGNEEVGATDLADTSDEAPEEALSNVDKPSG
ncbi:PREDICTED: uncharacterized protein LOC104611535 [Nelumbo nucifera]|uniref:Uncharacterized protein LOC104611535 n=1 Tax=Nelumbo nucifera TaxID=4432 RepID=A0A1U8B7C1_NELNU|nr:PREDICTED: uncharacterized protein LOC104611535 [Nelumbo nucifera]